MLLDDVKRNEITATLKLLHPENGLFEIRILKTQQGTVSGYFTDIESAVIAIESYVGKYDIYFTINPPNHKLLERSRNRLTTYAKQTTSDSEIERINWLLVDLDPVRKSGTASTDNEKRNAFELASIVVKGLRNDFDFPIPVICDSGNGFHLLYKLDMDNTPENANTLKSLLSVLDVLYSTDSAKVDRVTFNPARITKLYGVQSVKGDNSPERPHRWSCIKKIPNEIVSVSIGAINRVLEALPKPDDSDDNATPSNSESTNNFDLEKWLIDVMSCK